MLAGAQRGLALPWAATGLALAGNVVLGFAVACVARTRTGEPGAPASAAVALILMAPSLLPRSGPPGEYVPDVRWRRAVVEHRLVDRPGPVHRGRRRVGQRPAPASPASPSTLTPASRASAARACSTSAWPGPLASPPSGRAPASSTSAGGHRLCRTLGTSSGAQSGRGLGRTPMTYIAVSGLSHVGLVRDNNEDSLVVGPWTLCGTETGQPPDAGFPGRHAGGRGGRRRARRSSRR